jgi:hypothetical protein
MFSSSFAHFADDYRYSFVHNQIMVSEAPVNESVKRVASPESHANLISVSKKRTLPSLSVNHPEGGEDSEDDEVPMENYGEGLKS